MLASGNRRQFLLGSSVAALSSWTDPAVPANHPRLIPPKRSQPPTKKVAVITTIYYYLSHAYHICGRFFNGYLKGDTYHFPDIGIASMYVEQVKANDLSRELAEKHQVRLSKSIADALTLGTGQLAVDGVLLIGEHGDYPYNAKGQKLYPRYAMFQEIVKVFQQTGKVVPVFNDKHLSYDRHHGFAMAATAKKMGFPLYAGSSLPVTWRKPELELPLGCKLTEALVASRGELEIFGIHSLEALQCMVERRAGGEVGVKAVTCLEGDAVWRAGDAGLWSWELLEHAVGRTPTRNVGDIRENCRHFRPSPLASSQFTRSPVAFLIEYRDGFRAAVLVISGHIDDTTFAGRIAGQPKPVSTLFYLPPPPGAAFLEALSQHVETFLLTGKPPYPIERNVLTTGVLDWLLESRIQGGKRLETPDLDIRYQAPENSGFMQGDYTNPVATK